MLSKKVSTLILTCVTALLLMLPQFSNAQSAATISGTITDQKTGDLLPGASILVEGTSIGTSTNADGKYTLNSVPAGNQTLRISYLGFETLEEEVSVEAGQNLTLNIELTDNFIEMDGITVQGIRQGQARALNQQRTAANIKNVVASDLIGRFPDQNVADALRRVPAVSVQRDQGEARYVQIRGTNPNLSNISINGEQIPSPEGDVRYAALDMIPSDVLSSIEVTKAITPDMDGDAIGGSVNLNTLAASRAGKTLKVTLAPGYNNQNQDLSPFGGIAAMTYGDRVSDGKFGFLVSGSYQNANRASNNNEMEYGDGELETLELRDYELNRERAGLVTSLDYQFNNQSKVFLNTAFNYFTDTEYRRAFIAEADVMAREFKDRLEKQKIFSLSGGGQHALSDKWEIDYMASYSYADQYTPYDRNVVFEQAYEDPITEEDIEFVTFDDADPDYPQFGVNTAGTVFGAGAYSYGNFEFDEFEQSSESTSDQNFTTRLNLKMNYNLGTIAGDLKFGGLFRTKEKITTPRVRLYDYDGDFLYSDVQGDFEDDDFLDNNYQNGIGLFPDPDLLKAFYRDNRSSFELEDEDSMADSESETYNANEDTYAGYLMTNLRRDKLSGLVGFRYEFTSVDYNANLVEFDANGDLLPITSTSGTNDYNFFLPMVHLTYSVNPLVNIRAAWTNSFAKPNYFDLAPYRIVSREDEEIELGNPGLDATTSMNLDLMAEYYFNSVGVLSAGVFYKDIRDFIYIRNYEFSGGQYDGYEATQPVNGNNADLVGFELNLQQQLTFLPGFLSGLGVYGNYTYSWSEAELINSDGETRTVSLPGQAENTGNFALSYERSGFSGRVSLSYAGAFIDELRDEEGNDRIYDEHIQVDLSASQRINKNFTVFLELINLTNEPLRYYNGVSSRPEQQEFYSFWGNLGVKFEL
ncbi:TonB-dependent receptor [Gracilimonas sp.]|uniref:TonB-dependent receptor n=1 Tax=Gracilimonas sp. TaxID=1974203 RepID=UPI0032EC47C5